MLNHSLTHPDYAAVAALPITDGLYLSVRDILRASNCPPTHRRLNAWRRTAQVKRLIAAVSELPAYRDRPVRLATRNGYSYLVPELAVAYALWLAGSEFALHVRKRLHAAGLAPDVRPLRFFDLKPRYHARHLPAVDWLADELPKPEPALSETESEPNPQPYLVLTLPAGCYYTITDHTITIYKE